jgi:hypothetical protein
MQNLQCLTKFSHACLKINICLFLNVYNLLKPIIDAECQLN